MYKKPIIIACPVCDLIHRVEEISHGNNAGCSRCGAVLLRKKRNSVERTLALTIASLFTFVPASFSPIITLKTLGEIRSNNVFTGVYELFMGGFPDIALFVLLFSVIIPLIKLLSLLYILTPISFNISAPGSAYLFRMYLSVNRWAMLEVYLIGILVALTKLGDIATVIIGPGMYAFIALIILTLFISLAMDSNEIWTRIEGAA